jgi:putative RecB family exonuclease
MSESMTVHVDPSLGRLPAAVSPSQVSTFEQCGLKYWFVQVRGWREPPSQATAVGTLVHDSFEDLYRLPGPERTPDTAQELLRKRANLMREDPQFEPLLGNKAAAAHARTAVEGLYDLEDPITLVIDPEGLERVLIADVSGVPFSGRLDRMTSDGVVRITDYKTTPRHQSPAKLPSALRQLLLYAAAVEAAGGPAVEEVELLYPAVPQRVRRPVYPAALNRAIDEFVAMRESTIHSALTGNWNAVTGPLCNYCPFQRWCPAQTSDAPALTSPGSEEGLIAKFGIGRVAQADADAAAGAVGAGAVSVEPINIEVLTLESVTDELEADL